MRLLLTSIIFIILPLGLFSQVTISNLSLTKPEIKIIYWGIPNELEINSSYKGKIELKSDNEKYYITKAENNNFYVHPDNSLINKREILKIFVDNKLVAIDTFEIKRIPDPIVQLGSIKDSVATIEEIIQEPQLNMVFLNSFLKHECKVRGFILGVENSWGDIIYILPFEPDKKIIDTIYTIDPKTFNDTIIVQELSGATLVDTQGNKLTQRQIKYIKNLCSGDVLHFEAKGNCPDGSTRTYSFKIKIK